MGLSPLPSHSLNAKTSSESAARIEIQEFRLFVLLFLLSLDKVPVLEPYVFDVQGEVEGEGIGNLQNTLTVS